MAKKLYEESAVQAIAAAIRAKNGGSTTYKIGEMAAAIEALQGADNIQHADIPDYVKAAALAVASKVRAVQTSESITFIAMSDAHQLSTSADIVAGNKHAGMAAKVLAYALPDLDFCCYLVLNVVCALQCLYGRRHLRRRWPRDGSTSGRSTRILTRRLRASRSYGRWAIMTVSSTAHPKTGACCLRRSCTDSSAHTTPARR